jgi:MFS family permease
MVGYFPRHTIAWKIDEPAAFRALTLSVIESGLLAGIVLHLIHTFALAYIPESRGVLFAIVDVVLALALFAAAASHLANYPLRHWVWRAPAFAGVAAVGTITTSVVLLTINRERLGSMRANWHDLPSMAVHVLIFNVVSVCVFALLLAGVVQIVRSALLRHEHRTSTVDAVHEGRAG